MRQNQTRIVASVLEYPNVVDEYPLSDNLEDLIDIFLMPSKLSG